MQAFLSRIKPYWAAIILSVAAVVLAPSYWAAFNSPAAGTYHDDSVYLITAKSLAEGRGYLIESTVKPIVQTKYPVLFPALLSLVWKLSPAFPANLLLLKLVPFTASLVWLGLSFLLLKAQTSNAVFAAAAVALTAASPHTIFLSTNLLSETLFAALASGSILLLIRNQQRASMARVILAAVLAAAAFHTRTIGFCLVMAGMASLLWERRFRQLVWFGLVAGSLAAPWLIWQAIHRGPVDPYLSQENYYGAYNVVANFLWPEKMQIVLTNLLHLVLSPGRIFEMAWGWLLGILAVAPLLRALFRRELGLPVQTFLGFSLLVILLWVWPSHRFLIPILPLLLLAIWVGTPVRYRPACFVLCLLAGGWSASASLSRSNTARESGLWYPSPVAPTAWKSFQQQLDWIRRNTAPTAVIQANVDPTVFLYTGRHAIRGSHRNAHLAGYLDQPNALGSAEEFHQSLLRSGVTYVIDAPWSWFLESEMFTKLIEADRKAHPESWAILYQAADPLYKIYGFSAAGPGASAR